MIAAALGHQPDLRRPGMHAAQRLLARGRRAGTKASYAGKFSLFVRFCTDCQREHGCAPLSYLPASRRTVVCYVAWLRERGGVKESSLNPYISAINQAHADAGLQKPAIGDHLKLVRAGFAAEEGDTADAERRMPVPAAAILDILRLGLSTDDMRVLRDAVAVVVAFAFYARGDTGVLLLRKHVGISARGLTLSVRGKTVPRNVAAPTTREQYDKYDPDGLFMALVQRWHSYSATYQQPADMYWCLPGEQQRSWSSAAVDQWLQRSLLRVGWHPQPGEKWSGHSLRKGGASASHAIGVPLFTIMVFGIWRSLAAVQLYLSYLTVADRAAFLFFGWLLPRPFESLPPS